MYDCLFVVWKSKVKLFTITHLNSQSDTTCTECILFLLFLLLLVVFVFEKYKQTKTYALFYKKRRVREKEFYINPSQCLWEWVTICICLSFIHVCMHVCRYMIWCLFFPFELNEALWKPIYTLCKVNLCTNLT